MQKLFQYTLFFSLLLLSPTLTLFAQKQTITPYSTLIFYSIHSADSISTQNKQQLDSLPDNIQYYDPATQNNQVWATQGNIGKASRNIIPSFAVKPGFNLGNNCLDLYKYDPDQIKIYKHNYPFTDVHYVQGGKKEQVFEITHSQNIGKQFTATASLRIFNSPGSYQHQKSDVSNLIFTGQYLSKNSKYQANLSLCQNIFKLQENGGITNDSIFENNKEPDRRVISVNLLQAQNRIRETSVVLWQEYHFLKDSIVIKRPWLKYFPLTLSHSTRYTESSYVYEESDFTTTFYPFEPRNVNVYQDEIRYNQLTNKVLLHNPGQDFLQYAVGFTHEKIVARDKGNEDRYGQIATSFDVILNMPLKFTVRAKGQQYYGGYNEGDIFSELRITKYFGDKSHPKARLSIWNKTSSTQASWTQQHFESNLIHWENDFAALKTNSLGAEFLFKKLELGYRLHTLKHFIINQRITSMPEQLPGDLNIMQYYAQLRLKLWKIVLENRIDYQQVDHIINLHLPQIISRHSVYFDFNILNGAMILQPGFSVYWQSAYYADAYMPVTRSFYLQSKTCIKDQFYADIFVNMKVSRARIFLKYQHANSKLGPFDYYQIPHYPVQDAAIRFGVAWLLRDLPDHDKKFTVSENK